MKRSKLLVIKEWLAKGSKKPWAAFETAGPNQDGIMEFSISWNAAFVNKLRHLGFTGGNDEELVHMFFLSTRVLPEGILRSEASDESVNPSEMPRLSKEANYFKA